jgi:hypothetical protein
MSGNIWIAIGVLAAAFSAFAIPWGYHLKSKERSDEQPPVVVQGDYVAGLKVTGGGDYVTGDKIVNLGPSKEGDGTIVVPLVDLELVRVQATQDFAQFPVQFAYDIFLHNKSNVPICNIEIMRVLDRDKNKQKIAVHNQSHSNLSPFQRHFNVIGPGEILKVHREHSPSYEYMVVTITYQDASDNRFKSVFEGDRDSLRLKTKFHIKLEEPRSKPEKP